VLGTGTGLLIDRHRLFPEITADLRTGIGERRRFTLPDGSSIILNACSAVDVNFSDTHRTVRLRSGELIAVVAPNPSRPFTVRTDHGEVRALGTRFLVHQEADRSLAVVLEHAVTVDTAGGRQMPLHEGEGAWFDQERIGPVRTGLVNKAAWLNGMLSVRDESLGEVIAAVRPYRAGFIRLAPAAAQLRVLGAFSLDDTDRLLESLAQTLPIRITTYSRWLVVIDRA
jgi:transmembrane sensor